MLNMKKFITDVPEYIIYQNLWYQWQELKKVSDVSVEMSNNWHI